MVHATEWRMTLLILILTMSLSGTAFFSNVAKIMEIKYFNRIKQFMIRLYRNNLFLGHTLGKTPPRTKCYACDKHKESRVELLLNCSITNRLLQLMIRILRKGGCLKNGCKIYMFLFKRYPVNSLENITLRLLIFITRLLFYRMAIIIFIQIIISCISGS